MAGARHEPHSGGSPRLGNPVKPDNLKPLLCDLPLPAKKSKNTRPPPGLTTHQNQKHTIPLAVHRSILTLTRLPRPNRSELPRRARPGGQQPNTGSGRRSPPSYPRKCTPANTAARGLRGAGSSRSLNRRAKDQHSSNRDSPGGPTQKPGRCDSRAATRSYLAPSSSHLEVYALPHTCSARDTKVCDIQASRIFTRTPRTTPRAYRANQ